MRGCCFSTQASADLHISEIVEVPLAQTGEGIAECELLRWYVEEVGGASFSILIPCVYLCIIDCC